ncbi:DEAD/DEAH box helicase family protein [Cyanobacteria bacterium FACHB-63]|nr:DEAD/DEAH box helicase family protein [Cyanobacteria bacterium FACHB-63]
MSSRPLATKKTNPCPVCGDVKGKCRTFDDKPLILCMVAESAPGFKALGFTRDGLWMQFAPDSESFDHAAYLDRKRDMPAPIATMPVEERDRWYRQIVQSMTLTHADREYLKSVRGMSDREIEVFGAFSYKPDQKLPFTVPGNLPGIITKGQDQLLPAIAPGIYFPVANERGQIHALSIRFTNPVEGRRYGNCSTRTNPYNLIDCDGEQPIAVHFPIDQEPTGIAFAEATGFKPFLAAQRTGKIVIGSPGANFGGSAKQIRETLEYLTTVGALELSAAGEAQKLSKTGSNSGIWMILYPDAGSPLNDKIRAQYKRLYELCRSLGFDLLFAWWNQRTKEENDIDEATQAEIESAQLLSWEEFEALSATEDESPKGFSQTKSEDRSASERDRLIAKRVFRFRQYQEQLQRDFLMPIVVNGSEIRYQNYQGFAPIINLFWDTTCLQGWLGAGKTEAMLRSLIPFQDKAIVWVAPRNGLLRQTAQRAKKFGFEVYHYQDDPGKHRMLLEAGEPGIYFMAPDSFKSYAVSGIEWESTILAIDEFSGIRKEVLGKSAELPQFLDAIARCGSLIAADAFLSQIDIRVIQKHRSGSMQILRQDFKKSPTRIKWLECRNKEGEISFSHLGIYYSLLDRWIEQGFKRIAIAADNLRVAKLLDRYLKSKGAKTWLVCSESPEENASFMPAPDCIIQDGRVEAVIYTPTAQSGLDIQAEFDRGLLVATGVLNPLQMLQLMGRCRKCPEWHVSAPRYSGNPECVTPSLDGRKIQQWSEKIALASEALEFNSPESIQAWSIWEDLTRNIEKAFNSEYLRHLLDYFFESVEPVEVESDRAGEWRKDSEILTHEEQELKLKANLEKGLRLIDEQKQPKLNCEVWDVKLAELWLKYPKIIDKAIADYGVEEWRDDAIKMTRLFSSRRLEKLRNWVIATEPNEQDDRDLRQYLKERMTHYNAGNFKRLQNIKLFRSLGLEKLAIVRNPEELKAGANAFCATSDAIGELYREFLAMPDLVKLFPFVECQKTFFNAIKVCLSYLGYEKGSKSIRVETNELNPNGHDRNGSQRFSKSRSIYFVYWFAMECSGSAYFREHFTLIVEAIRDRLETEREERRKWREKHESPPIPIAA